VVVGLALALSSTAIAIATMTERNFLPTPTGQSGFAVLLFQDIAAIPLLAVIPLLGVVVAGSEPGLDELAFSNNVIPASPTSLIGLLRAIHYGWQQETIAEGARQISDLGRELYKRLSTMGAHVSKLGRSLDGAVKSYNETVGSLERQVLPQARRFEQHGITGIEPPELVPVERQTRSLSSPELTVDTPSLGVLPAAGADAA